MIARRHATGAGLVVTLVLAVAAAGCSKPTLSGLHNSVSGCYRAIPVATAAVRNPKAHLVGVHRVPADGAMSHLPAPDRNLVEQDAVVCAVAFKGPFAPGQVAKAPTGSQGEYAVVLVTSKKLQLVSSYVLATLPKSFRGRLT